MIEVGRFQDLRVDRLERSLGPGIFASHWPEDLQMVLFEILSGLSTTLCCSQLMAPRLVPLPCRGSFGTFGNMYRST